MSVTRAGTVYKQNSGMENRNGTTSENRGVVEELSSGRGELSDDSETWSRQKSDSVGR